MHTVIISSEADTCNCLHGEEAGVNREVKCSYESDHTLSSFWKCKCPHWKLWGMHKYLNSCLGTAQPAKSPKQFPSSKLRNIAECLNWEMQQSTLPARKHLPPVRNIRIYLFIIFKAEELQHFLFHWWQLLPNYFWPQSVSAPPCRQGRGRHCSDVPEWFKAGARGRAGCWKEQVVVLAGLGPCVRCRLPVWKSWELRTCGSCEKNPATQVLLGPCLLRALHQIQLPCSTCVLELNLFVVSSLCCCEQMKSSDIDQELFTESYCKVCSAQLISESQRVAHYEVGCFLLISLLGCNSSIDASFSYVFYSVALATVFPVSKLHEHLKFLFENSKFKRSLLLVAHYSVNDVTATLSAACIFLSCLNPQSGYNLTSNKI